MTEKEEMELMDGWKDVWEALHEEDGNDQIMCSGVGMYADCSAGYHGETFIGRIGQNNRTCGSDY